MYEIDVFNKKRNIKYFYDVNVSPNEDAVWLSKDDMSILFQRDRSVISRHIANIYKEGELLQQNITEIFPATTSMVESTLSDELIYDGVEREMMVYRKNRTCFRALVKAIQTEEAISPYVIMITMIKINRTSPTVKSTFLCVPSA